jgi:hypothetical protein
VSILRHEALTLNCARAFVQTATGDRCGEEERGTASYHCVATPRFNRRCPDDVIDVSMIRSSSMMPLSSSILSWTLSVRFELYRFFSTEYDILDTGGKEGGGCGGEGRQERPRIS